MILYKRACSFKFAHINLMVIPSPVSIRITVCIDFIATSSISKVTESYAGLNLISKVVQASLFPQDKINRIEDIMSEPMNNMCFSLNVSGDQVRCRDELFHGV